MGAQIKLLLKTLRYLKHFSHVTGNICSKFWCQLQSLSDFNKLFVVFHGANQSVSQFKKLQEGRKRLSIKDVILWTELLQLISWTSAISISFVSSASSVLTSVLCYVSA